MKNDINKVLFKPELKSLAGGKSWSTLGFLVFIYSVALFSLGAGDQIQQYLKKQMEDPFVEGVSVLVPKTDCSSKTLKEVLLDNDTFKSKYAIQNARLFHRAYAIVQGKDGRKTLAVGSYDGSSHPLWEMLQSKPELFLTPYSQCQPFSPLTRCGVILSEKALKGLGYDASKLDELPATVDWFNDSSIDIPAKLPILAIVESLPHDIDVAIQDETWGYLSSGVDGDYTEAKTWFVSEKDINGINGVKSLVSADLPTGTLFSGVNLGEGMAQVKNIGVQMNVLSVNDSSYARLLQSKYAEHIHFSLGDLAKVRALAEDLLSDKPYYGCADQDNNSSKTLEINLTDIESKENLHVFNSFANLLSYALVLISLILIVNYTGAVLRLHINKNKRNLGTLTAFGYPNKTIISLYLRITATILGGSFLISYLLVWPLGFFGFKAFLGVFGLSDALSDVSFAHIPIYYSLPLFVLLPLAVVAWRIQGQLKATPGDLVYDR